MSGGNGGAGGTGSGGAGGGFGEDGTPGGPGEYSMGYNPVLIAGGGGGGGGANGGLGGAAGSGEGGAGGNGGIDGMPAGLPGTNTTAVTAGNGISGTDGGTDAGGGGGGAGGYGLEIGSALLVANSFNNTGNVTAGSGGDGGAAADPYPTATAYGGGGGDGGIGIDVSAPAAALQNTATIAGGNGGAGGDGGQNTAGETGGFGGTGGDGVHLSAGSTFDNAMGASVTGGTGGKGGDSIGSRYANVSANSGNGGAGVSASQATITNEGTLTGGNGGAPSQTYVGFLYQTGPAGLGGAGVAGSNLVIVNEGTIAGGVSGDATPIQADAIALTGGANTLALGTNATFTGAVDVMGTGTTLTFDQSAGTALPANATLSVALTGTGSASKVGAGTLTLAATGTLSGGFTVSAGSLDLAALRAAGSGIITLGGSADHPTNLVLETAAQPASDGLFSNTITGLGNGNDLDLKGFTFNPADVQDSLSGYILSVTNGTLTEKFSLSNPVSTYTSHDDGHGGTLIEGTGPIVCFAAGTLIRTVCGDVPVEALAIGDHVVTSSGAKRRIRWLGQRTIDCRDHPRPQDVLPVRIAAHAFARNRPSRDLHVSPGHCICVDILGSLLVPAGALVNGATVRQIDVDEITYWHVELDSHDVILAENLPAESYLDMGNRGFFEDANDTDSLDAAPPCRTQADFCHPYHDAGPVVAALKTALKKRAKQLGWTLASDIDLHLEVDGRRFEPVVRDLTVRFHVPAGARALVLVSSTARPCDVLDDTDDDRDLGICFEGFAIDDGFGVEHPIPINDPRLDSGLHAVEEGYRRWTAGRTPLPADFTAAHPDGFFLRVQLAGPAIPRWVAPVVAEASVPRLRLVPAA